MKIRVTTPPDPPPSQIEAGIISATIDNAYTIALLAHNLKAKVTSDLAMAEAQAVWRAQGFADTYYPSLGIKVLLDEDD